MNELVGAFKVIYFEKYRNNWLAWRCKWNKDRTDTGFTPEESDEVEEKYWLSKMLDCGNKDLEDIAKRIVTERYLNYDN